MYSRLRRSTITESMPRRASRCESMSPAGPAPMMPTCVFSFIPYLARVVELISAITSLTTLKAAFAAGTPQ